MKNGDETLEIEDSQSIGVVEPKWIKILQPNKAFAILEFL